MAGRSDWWQTVDWVCVGSGVGGAAAALAGADAGLETVLLEKEAVLGGTTTWSYGLMWVGNTSLGATLGVADSAEETRTYLDYLGAGRNDPAITASYVEHGPATVEFLQHQGVPLYVVPGLPDHYYPFGPGAKPQGRTFQARPFAAAELGAFRLRPSPYNHDRATFEEMARWGGRAAYRNWDHATLAEREASDVRASGSALVGHLLKAGLDCGVQVYAETALQRLVVDDGRIVGVEVEQGGETRAIRARRGVLIASGSYAGNQQLVQWFNEYKPWPSTRPAGSDGDGLVCALEQGAAPSVLRGSLGSALAYHVPGEESAGAPFVRVAGSREVAYPHSILVNRAGQRFADEATFGDVAARLRAFDAWTHQPLNLPCYLVFDAQYLDRFGLWPLRPGDEAPPWLPSAPTLPALAERIGVDGPGLTATVERFNRFVAAGRDEDFHRGEASWSRAATSARPDAAHGGDANLGSVAVPPYYGLPLQVDDGGGSLGLVIDGHGQVTHLRGHAMPGLYGCGDVIGYLHVGVGYQAGLSIAGAITFGRLAARHAAGLEPG